MGLFARRWIRNLDNQIPYHHAATLRYSCYVVWPSTDGMTHTLTRNYGMNQPESQTTTMRPHRDIGRRLESTIPVKVDMMLLAPVLRLSSKGDDMMLMVRTGNSNTKGTTLRMAMNFRLPEA